MNGFLLVCLYCCISYLCGIVLSNSHVGFHEQSNMETVILTDLMNRNHELEVNNTKLQAGFDELKMKFELLEEMVNKTLFQEIHSLKEQLNTIGTKSFLLELKDNTRSRDISTLYNKSMESERVVASLTNDMDVRFQKNELYQNSTAERLLREVNMFYSDSEEKYNLVMRNISSLETDKNVTDIVTNFSKQLEDYKDSNTRTHDSLLQRVSEASLKVGMTACVSVDGIVQAGRVIKFDQFRSHVGIADLSPIRSHGEFVCEKDGLYHVAVVINTPTTNARFSIHVNGNIVSTLVVSNDNHADTGTAVVAVELNVGDRVWAETDTDIHVYFHWSCMTIIKI